MTYQLSRVLRMPVAWPQSAFGGQLSSSKSFTLPENLPDPLYITYIQTTVEDQPGQVPPMFFDTAMGYNRFTIMVDPGGIFSATSGFPAIEAAPYENLVNMHIVPVYPGAAKLPPATQFNVPLRYSRSEGDKIIVAAAPLANNATFRLIHRIGFIAPTGYVLPPTDNMVDSYTMFLLGDDGTNLIDKSFLGPSSPHSFTLGGDAVRDTAWWPYSGTGASVKMSGNGTLNIPYAKEFAPGASDFAIVSRFRLDSLSATPRTLFTRRIGATGGIPYHVYVDSAGVLKVSMSSNGTSQDICNNVVCGTITPGADYEIEISREGSTFRCFLNGAVGATWTSSAAIFDNGADLKVGYQDGGFGWVGNIAGFMFKSEVPRHRANYTMAADFPH